MPVRVEGPEQLPYARIQVRPVDFRRLAVECGQQRSLGLVVFRLLARIQAPALDQLDRLVLSSAKRRFRLMLEHLAKCF
jgi:hypothetical protein